MFGADPEVQSWKILVVDDDEDNLNVASQFLRFMGAEVHTAVDGQSGLDVLKSFEPTFVLLDLSMPEMDGWEMHRRIRAEASTAHLPVIALTAHAMPEDAERAIADGFNGYITKPFMLDSLLSNIKSCLARI